MIVVVQCSVIVSPAPLFIVIFRRGEDRLLRVAHQGSRRSEYYEVLPRAKATEAMSRVMRQLSRQNKVKPKRFTQRAPGSRQTKDVLRNMSINPIIAGIAACRERLHLTCTSRLSL